MLSYAQKTGAKKIAVAYSDVPYGVGGAKLSRRRQGCRRSKSSAIPNGAKTISISLPKPNQLHAAKADAILVWEFVRDFRAQMIKALRDTGDTTPVIGNICLPLPHLAARS